jgi:molybdopterin-containing oxidoreductase family membrane subunit
MVLTLMLPLRRLYRLEDIITSAHLDVMGKMMLITGWIVTYSYGCELFIAWLGDDPYEMWMHLVSRPRGPFAATFWIVIFCNVLTPQVLWSKAVRTSPVWLFVVTLFVQLGMWMERFMLIVTAEAQDFLPSSWRGYRPSAVDMTILFGTISFFLFLFCLFLRFAPFIPMSELKAMRFEIRREKEIAA